MVVLREPDEPLTAVVSGVKEGESTFNLCFTFSFDACEGADASLDGSWTYAQPLFS